MLCNECKDEMDEYSLELMRDCSRCWLQQNYSTAEEMQHDLALMEHFVKKMMNILAENLAARVDDLRAELYDKVET